MPQVSVDVSAGELPDRLLRRLGASPGQIVRVTAEIVGGEDRIHEGMPLAEIARIMSARAKERGMTADVLAEMLDLSESERRNLLDPD